MFRADKTSQYHGRADNFSLFAGRLGGGLLSLPARSRWSVILASLPGTLYGHGGRLLDRRVFSLARPRHHAASRYLFLLVCAEGARLEGSRVGGCSCGIAVDLLQSHVQLDARQCRVARSASGHSHGQRSHVGGNHCEHNGHCRVVAAAPLCLGMADGQERGASVRALIESRRKRRGGKEGRTRKHGRRGACDARDGNDSRPRNAVSQLRTAEADDERTRLARNSSKHCATERIKN